MRLEPWLERARVHFRLLASQEPAEVLERTTPYLNLGAPCQIFGFTCAAPAWQGFAVTRMPALADEISVKEDIPSHAMHDALAEVFVHAAWDQPFNSAPKGYGRFLSMREVGFQALDQLHSSQRVAGHIDFGNAGLAYVQHSRVAPDCDEYTHVGPLPNVLPEQWVDQAFKEGRDHWQRDQARAAQPPPEPRPIPERVEETYPAHGAFHARQIRIGIIASNRLGDWYWAQREFPGIITYRGKLGSFDFVATHNGFLCVVTPNKAEANRWMNYVMAGFLSEGLPAVVVRDQDMASVHLPVGNEYTWGGTYPGTDRRRGSFLDQQRILKEELDAVLRKAEHHAAQPYASQIPSLLEAHTHLAGNEPTQSFVYSWAIIERIFADKWASYLMAGEISSNRREKLEGTAWTLDMRSETLELAKAISQELYDKLTPVRRARNRIFHGRNEATREQAVQAIDLANELLSDGGPPLRAPRKTSPYEIWIGEYL